MAARHWDLGGLGVDYAMILASFGGFTVTGAIFLAELREDGSAQAYADVIALFLTAFVILTGTAVSYATLRNAVHPEDSSIELQVSHRVMYVLATTCFFLGVCLSLLGLLPMLVAIGLAQVAQTFSWLLLFVVLAGGMRLGAWLHSLLGMEARAAILMPFISLGGALAYRAAASTVLPWAWPGSQATLLFSILVFVLAAFAFFIETSMIRMQHRDDAHGALYRFGPALVPVYSSCGVTAILLVWLSLVYPV